MSGSTLVLILRLTPRQWHSTSWCTLSHTMCTQLCNLALAQHTLAYGLHELDIYTQHEDATAACKYRHTFRSTGVQLPLLPQ
jgi:hypothetical protein